MCRTRRMACPVCEPRSSVSWEKAMAVPQSHGSQSYRRLALCGGKVEQARRRYRDRRSSHAVRSTSSRHLTLISRFCYTCARGLYCLYWQPISGERSALLTVFDNTTGRNELPLIITQKLCILLFMSG
jgi:hypothetical protein